MSDKGSASPADMTVEKKPRRRGCIGHCIKFWWAYLIAFICVVVLVVCLVIFVGIPKIAQSKLDEAELTIDGITVSNSESDRLTMAINSTIRSDGKVHATIEGFLGEMYLEDLEPHTAFAHIQFPQTTSDALQTVNVSQTLDISNKDALVTFNTWLLANESLRVTVRGDTFVHVKGISKRFPVIFKKTLSMPGLRHFDGLTVTDTSVEVPGTDNSNFFGTVNIPNYSFFTLEIGNTSFNTYLLDRNIGITHIDNLRLVPGLVNEFPMRAKVDTGATLEALETKPYCDEKKGVLPFKLSGESVVNHGQSLEYFARALAAANQTVDIDLGTPVAELLGSRPECKEH